MIKMIKAITMLIPLVVRYGLSSDAISLFFTLWSLYITKHFCSSLYSTYTYTMLFAQLSTYAYWQARVVQSHPAEDQCTCACWVLSSEEVRPSRASWGMQAMKEVGLFRETSDAGVVNTEEGSKPPGEGGMVIERMYTMPYV